MSAPNSDIAKIGILIGTIELLRCYWFPGLQRTVLGIDFIDENLFLGGYEKIVLGGGYIDNFIDLYIHLGEIAHVPESILLDTPKSG
jgi:hypothetical protein